MNESWILGFLVGYPFVGGLLSWTVGKCAGLGADGKAGCELWVGGLMADFFVVTEFLVMAALFCHGVKLLAAGSAGLGADGAVLSLYVPEICGFGLSFVLDGFRLVYGMIAAFMWMMAVILSRRYFAGHGNTARFYLFMLLTLGATMGVFLSSDLYTTFVFFEMMSFTSYVWVAQEENVPSLRAADTYLAVAVIGGLVMLMGIFVVRHELGTLQMAELSAAAAAYENKPLLYGLGCCMLVGFGAKAGAFPLHIWLPKAHPVAPAPASALLSGILTKTGIFGVLVTTCGLFRFDARWGSLILLIGVLTMLIGALLAVFSVDLKRTLACSSMSQVGFILIGVGMQGLLGEENALAVHGTMLQMVNHSLIKLVLFLAAGVIYMDTHALDLNEIRGYGRKKPFLKVVFLIGALAIGGIPFFGGYISKTLLHESIVEFGGGMWMHALEYVFLFSGGLTVAYMTKLFTAVFIEKNEDPARQQRYDGQAAYRNVECVFALGGSAAVLLCWGLFPHTLMDRVAALGQGLMGLSEFGHVVNYFSLTNLSGGLVSITIGALVYLLVIRRFLMKEGAYVNRWPSWLDLENRLYRPVLMEFIPLLSGACCYVLDVLTDQIVRMLIPVGAVCTRVLDSLADGLVVSLRRSIYRDSPLPHERTEGNLFTDCVGDLMNGLQSLANRIWRRSRPTDVDYRHRAAVRYEELRESELIIGRSLSFGLMLAGVGLCLTLIYILWM
ncbi:MAG: sodium:proton antiporter [Clostridiales bacterium]|nr:sodium:proton antiporter [Clostridiales bacterium]